MPRRGSNFTDDSRDESNYDDGDHYVCSGITLGYVIEELDEGVPCVAVKQTLRVCDCEAKRQDRDVAEYGVETDTTQ